MSFSETHGWSESNPKESHKDEVIKYWWHGGHETLFLLCKRKYHKTRYELRLGGEGVGETGIGGELIDADIKNRRTAFQAAHEYCKEHP